MMRLARPWLPSLEEYAAALEAVWESRMLSNAGECARGLEEAASRVLGAPAAAVSSGDAGLLLALRTLDLPAGASVGVSAFTFPSTANAVVWNGLRPYLLDVDPATFCVSPEAVERAVRDGRIDALLATHVFGVPCDAPALRAALDGRSLAFDAAHALGTAGLPDPIGALGDVQAFSLSGTKVATSAEGGLVSAADPDRVRRVRVLRAYGVDGGEAVVPGLNAKMSEIHAALGALALERLDEGLSRRRAVAEGYRAGLDGLVSFQSVPDGVRPNHAFFACVLSGPEERARVEEGLRAGSIETRRYFVPLFDQPAYGPWSDGVLPQTRWLADRVLCLPMHEELTPGDVETICACVRDSLG